MELLNLKIDLQTNNYAKMYDSARMKRQARRSLESTKEGRSERKMQKLRKQQYFEESEDLLYAPGMAD